MISEDLLPQLLRISRILWIIWRIAKNEERVLNLKLDDVEYLTYDTQDEMFEDFYAGKCRAVILTSNQIKYLTNNKENQKQNIKILYTFKANGHK